MDFSRQYWHELNRSSTGCCITYPRDSSLKHACILANIGSLHRRTGLQRYHNGGADNIEPGNIPELLVLLSLQHSILSLQSRTSLIQFTYPSSAEPFIMADFEFRVLYADLNECRANPFFVTHSKARSTIRYIGRDDFLSLHTPEPDPHITGIIHNKP